MDGISPLHLGPPAGAKLRPAHPEGPLWDKAVALEAAFLSEMLAHTGLDGGTGGQEFSGGVGEEQFSSFLRQEQATLMARRGGVGLAEALFRSLGGKASDAP